MTTFSQPVDYSITSSNTVDTITLNGASGSGYTIGTGSSGAWITSINTASPTFTITSSGNMGIGSIDPVTFKWKNEEFIDCFPDFDRIKAMCEEYPGLKIAFEKFATTYKLVKDHYDTPEDQRPIP